MNRTFENHPGSLAIAFILMLLAITLGEAQNPQQESLLRFGLTSSQVESDVNIDDALAATRVWAATMGKGIGLWTKSEAVIYDSPASLLATVNKGESDIVALGTHEYLEIQDSLKAIPTLTYLSAGQAENQYLIVVHRDSPFKSIVDLRNQRIAWTKGGRSTMIPLWLEVFLNENGVRENQKFFRETKEVQKPSQVILPIFFKQIESGIVLKSSYDTAIALNPQVGQQTRILAASPRLVMLVICMRSALSAEKREQYIRQALKLHETPSGLQSFALFKLDRLVPWEPSYLDNVRELLRKRKMFRSAALLQLRTNSPEDTEKHK